MKKNSYKEVGLHNDSCHSYIYPLHWNGCLYGEANLLVVIAIILINNESINIFIALEKA